METFRKSFKCYSVCLLPGREKPEAEKGGKIFLPPSALQQLSNMNVEYPMLFRLHNKNAKRTTHCGVLEFVADEGQAYLPHWMMNNLLLEEGSIVDIENVSLPLASFAKFEPQSVDFLDITNPKAALENALRSFSCLTKGDIISFHYNTRFYEMKVLETKPGNAISIIECDMSVDFSPPVGYVEPERPVVPVLGYDENVKIDVSQFVEKKFEVFGGPGARLNGKVKPEDKPEEEKSYERGVPNFGHNRKKLTFIRKTIKNDVEPKNVNDKKFTAFEGEGQSMRKKK